MQKELHLHDESVVNIRLQNDTLQLVLERYVENLDIALPYSIFFYQVSGLKVDDAAATAITQPTDSGEVMTFKQDNGKAKLLLLWHGWPGQDNQYTLYEFSFQRMEVKAGRTT